MKPGTNEIMEKLTRAQRKMLAGAYYAHNFLRNYGCSDRQLFLAHWANRKVTRESVMCDLGYKDRENAVGESHEERVCQALTEKGLLNGSRASGRGNSYHFTEDGLVIAESMEETLPIRERLAWEKAMRDEYDRQNTLFVVERQVTVVRYERTVVSAKSMSEAAEKHKLHMSGVGSGGVPGVCVVESPKTQKVAGPPMIRQADCSITPSEVREKSRNTRNQLELLFGEATEHGNHTQHC